MSLPISWPHRIRYEKTRAEMLTASTGCFAFMCSISLTEVVTENSFVFSLTKSNDKIKFFVTFRGCSFLIPEAHLYHWLHLIVRDPDCAIIF